MPIQQLNGIDLYYETSGEGPALLFLHGASGNHLSWWQQVPHFDDRYRCITIDQRGFGRSGGTTAGDADQFAEDVVALLDRLEVDTVAVVAQSMGGRPAIDLAVRHPQRVSAIVMGCTWGFFEWAPGRSRQAAGGVPRGPEAESMLPMLGMAFQREHPALTFLYEQVAGVNGPIERSWRTGGPSPEQVAAIDRPMLFTAGLDDAVIPPELIRAAHELVPVSEYMEFPALGHSAHWEDPAAFNAAVDDFLGRHWPASR